MDGGHSGFRRLFVRQIGLSRARSYAFAMVFLFCFFFVFCVLTPAAQCRMACIIKNEYEINQVNEQMNAW